MCPGLAIGVRAARYALRELGPHAQDEEVVAVVETDMCAVDAIQSLVGCTFGKGNLIHRDHGKNAFTFHRRADGKGVRLVTRPGAFPPRDPAVDEAVHRARRTEEILTCAEDALFRIEPVTAPPPLPARIHGSVVCEDCGEGVMETRSRRFGGRVLCIPCFERADRRT